MGTRPEAIYYHAPVQGLAVTGKITTGFALLARAEACDLLSHQIDSTYRSIRTLLDACNLVVGSYGTPRVQAAVERLDLVALAPAATVLVEDTELRFENGDGDE